VNVLPIEKHSLKKFFDLTEQEVLANKTVP